MTVDVVERVLESARYRDVDRSVVARLAEEELPRSRNVDDAVKRVKRRLHQAVGAFRGERRAARLVTVEDAWRGDMTDAGFRQACVAVMSGHASTRERVPHLDLFYRAIWAVTGPPRSVLDVGCGLAPLALPWMALARDARYVATDVDHRPLATVARFLGLVGQPHDVRAADAVADPPPDEADVALLLKIVPTLDRQDAGAARRLVDALRVHHAVVSFPARALGGRRKGMERTYRTRLERLVDESMRVTRVAEASVPNELVFVLSLDG